MTSLLLCAERCAMPGQVENYMTEIVVKMRGELRDVLRDSVVDYTTKPRDKWLFDWPSQIILVVNQVFWCQEVEQVKLCAVISDGRADTAITVMAVFLGLPASFNAHSNSTCHPKTATRSTTWPQSTGVTNIAISRLTYRRSRQWRRVTGKQWPNTTSCRSSS
jgi:hypothetical protein